MEWMARVVPWVYAEPPTGPMDPRVIVVEHPGRGRQIVKWADLWFSTGEMIVFLALNAEYFQRAAGVRFPTNHRRQATGGPNLAVSNLTRGDLLRMREGAKDVLGEAVKSTRSRRSRPASVVEVKRRPLVVLFAVLEEAVKEVPGGLRRCRSCKQVFTPRRLRAGRPSAYCSEPCKRLAKRRAELKSYRKHQPERIAWQRKYRDSRRPKSSARPKVFPPQAG